MTAFYQRFSADVLWNQLVKHSVTLLTGSSFVAVLTIIKTAILGHFLGPEGLGVYALVLSYTTAVNQFVDLRVNDMATYFASRYLAEKDESKSFSVIKLSYLVDGITGLMAFAIVMVTASKAAEVIIHQTEAALFIQIYAFSLLISTVDNTSSAVLKIFEHFSWISTYNTVMAIIEVVAVLIAVWNSWGVMGVLILLLVKDAVSALTNTFLARRAIRKNYGDRLWWREGKLSLLHGLYGEIGRFLWHTNLVRYARMLITQVDVLVLGYFASVTEVGIYKLALSIARLVAFTSDPILTALLPTLSRLYTQQQLQRYKQLLLKTAVMTLVVSFFTATIVWWLRNWALLLLGGESYLPGENITQIAIWALAIQGSFIWLSPVAMSVGGIERLSIGHLGQSLLQVLLLFWLVPKFQGVGAAWALLIANIVALPFMGWWITQKLSPAPPHSLEVPIDH